MATVVDVEKVFQDAVEKLQELANLNSATPEQRQASRDALNDLLLLHGTHVIQEIEGRTAMLTGLIAELENVVGVLQGTPSVAQMMDQVNGIIGRARTVYEDAKDDLRTS